MWVCVCILITTSAGLITVEMTPGGSGAQRECNLSPHICLFSQRLFVVTRHVYLLLHGWFSEQKLCEVKDIRAPDYSKTWFTEKENPLKANEAAILVQ